MPDVTPLPFDTPAIIGDLPRARLEAMAAAGSDIKDCYRLLRKAGQNIVGQCLAHQGEFYEMDHYPRGDVYDWEHHAQYYYHAHRPDSGEHGHFHTFIRAEGIPKDIKPAQWIRRRGACKRPVGRDALCHLVAISMNGPGFPVALFTTNRWVTDESYYTAEDSLRLADGFIVDHTYPCLAVNRWITAMVVLFRPQIIRLLIARDDRLREWRDARPESDVLEDPELEVTSMMPIDVDEQIAAVNGALTR